MFRFYNLKRISEFPALDLSRFFLWYKTQDSELRSYKVRSRVLSLELREFRQLFGSR